MSVLICKAQATKSSETHWQKTEEVFYFTVVIFN